jgi:hypothetical protein
LGGFADLIQRSFCDIFKMYNSDYLKSVAEKLERLRVANGESPTPVKQNHSGGDGFDPFDAMGRAGIEWLKKNGKWPINGG